jgi:hypothetical protein
MGLGSEADEIVDQCTSTSSVFARHPAVKKINGAMKAL